LLALYPAISVTSRHLWFRRCRVFWLPGHDRWCSILAAKAPRKPTLSRAAVQGSALSWMNCRSAQTLLVACPGWLDTWILLTVRCLVGVEEPKAWTLHFAFPLMVVLSISM
jgi:hypothetical protein